MKMLRLLLLLIFFISAAFAQDSLPPLKRITVNGYIKDLQSLNFDKDFRNLVTGNLLHNRLNFKWKSTEQVTAVAELRTRLFWGEEVRLTPGFVALLRNEIEKVNMQKAWIDDESLVLHSNVERLYLDYRKEDLNVRIGRQRINWGVTTTWNPNDIFNAFNFLDFDYEERPGVDGGKVQYILSNSSSAEMAYAFSGKSGSVGALKYSLNRWNYDMQVIAGWFNDHPTAGLGWAGYIRDTGFKGEAQYYFPTGDTSGHINLALEGDYMFKKGWYVNAGFLFNQQGLDQPVNDWTSINLKLSPENLMPTRWNFILSGAKEINPLLSANLGVLYAPGTELLIVLPSFQYSMAPNLDVNLIGQSFFAEIANDFEGVNTRLFLRLRWSF
jgi:hypothetical protein